LRRVWEFMGHGFTQRNMQKVENEREDIRKTADVIAAATGKRPRGWLGPGLTETWETPDLLKEEGYEYVADWVLDDQPVWLRTTTTPIVNVPYTQECNDVAMMLIQHHKASEYYDRAIDQFEQIYEDSAGFCPGHGIGFAPLHHGRAASPEIFPPHHRGDPAKIRRHLHDGRADSRLVPVGWAKGTVSTIRDEHLQLLNGLTFAALLFVVASGFTLIFGCCGSSTWRMARFISSVATSAMWSR